MVHGSIKGIVGIWLVTSAFIPSLYHPANMIATGFVAAVCCFSSQKLWQAATTGVIGLWLFLSGLHDWTVTSSRIMVTKTCFLISGLLLVLVGLLSVLLTSQDESVKNHLKVG